MRASGRVFALVLAGLLASACGIKSTVNWEQESGTCPASPQMLLIDGGVLNSGLCGSAEDCQATCCTCDNDAGQFWAAACNENYCVDPCQAGQGPGGACH